MLAQSEAADFQGYNLRALWTKAYRSPWGPRCPDQDATEPDGWSENTAGDEDGSDE
jgi:hypothetical protein